MNDLDNRLSVLVRQLEVTDPLRRAELDRRVRRVRARRSVSVGGFLALVLVVIVASVVALRHQHHAQQIVVVEPTTTPAAARRSSIPLPASPLYQDFAVVNGVVQLSGAVDSSLHARCARTVVDLTTLQLGAVKTGSCDDPATAGTRVGIVNAYLPKSNNATIRVARTDPRNGRLSIGPVVMTFSAGSTSNPVSAATNTWLWIYDVDSTDGPELLQVSAESGAVVNTVRMPTIYRPAMAANDDGIWIGPTIDGPIPAVDTLYHVAPASKQPTVVLGTHDAVCWLTASGHDLWAGTGPTCVQQTIRRFRGSGGQLVFTVPDRGIEPNTVIGNETDGLWTMQWVPPPSATLERAFQLPQEIVRIDPDTGAERVVARLPETAFSNESDESNGLVAGQAVYFRGTLYLLEPPFQQNGYLGYSKLIRIPVPK